MPRSNFMQIIIFSLKLYSSNRRHRKVETCFALFCINSFIHLECERVLCIRVCRAFLRIPCEFVLSCSEKKTQTYDNFPSFNYTKAFEQIERTPKTKTVNKTTSKNNIIIKALEIHMVFVLM